MSARYEGLRDALLTGYSSRMPITPADEEILPALIFARQMNITAWMHFRSDNPRIRRSFVRTLPETLAWARRSLRGDYWDLQ